MSIASLKNVPEDMRISVITIHSYADKNPVGIFHNMYYGCDIPFENLTRLLLLLEDLMDEMDCPQAAVKARNFGAFQKARERMTLNSSPQFRKDAPVLATFTIKVLFRQQASWQGKIGWKEGQREETFRSALELVKLMDSALPQPEVVQRGHSAAVAAG